MTNVLSALRDLFEYALYKFTLNLLTYLLITPPSSPQLQSVRGQSQDSVSFGKGHAQALEDCGLSQSRRCNLCEQPSTQKTDSHQSSRKNTHETHRGIMKKYQSLNFWKQNIL